MLSAPNSILRKIKNHYDNCFLSGKGYIQFAIEVEEPRQLPEFIDKLKKSTTGLYIKTDGTNYIRNSTEFDNVTIHRIPTQASSLQNCCEWIYNKFTPNPNYALGSIAADETRVVVNSCHALTDGSFFQRLVRDLTDKKSDFLFDSIFPAPGDIEMDLLREEFDKIKSNISKFNRRDYTYVNLQEWPEIPDPDDKKMVRLTHEMDIDHISIYDKNSRKLKGLTEFLWTAFTMSICAINGSFGPFGLGTVFDFRRSIPSTRIDRTFGSCFTDFMLTIKNQSPRKTIGEMCSEFRKSFDVIKNSNGFYQQFLNPFKFEMEGRSIGSVSNVGPFEFKKPLKDVYCQFFASEVMTRNQMQVTALSKVRKDIGLNRFIFQYFFSPKIITKKTGNEIFQTFLYFIQNVKHEMKAGDVYDDLLKFRNSLS